MSRIVIFWILVAFTSCQSEVIIPKPRIYPRVIYPNKAYKQFSLDKCPMQFLIPTYSEVIKDGVLFDTSVENECWFDIYIQQFNCKIHCSYYELENDNQFDKLLSDAFKLAGKHTIKANYIDEQYFETEEGGSGFIFELTGPVASPYQFFITDSTHHFLRGALYFNTQARPDSLAPITQFIKDDIHVMLESFEWN